MSALMISISGVRGIVGEDFHPLLVASWCAAFSASQPNGTVLLGCDSRPSGPLFDDVAASVLRSCGRDVIELGTVPTPTVQLSVREWEAAGGIVLSASHNPGEWNAMKFVDRGGSFLTPDRFSRLREAVESFSGGFVPFDAWGRRTFRGEAALRLHRQRIKRLVDAEAIRRAGVRVLLDCVHGAGGVLLPHLLREIGVKVLVRHEEPHGRFPRDPEPTGPALDALAKEAADLNVDFAVAIDPDADRCAVAVPRTEIVGEEWTLPLVAAHLLANRRGTVVTNLSTSTRIEAVAGFNGCRVERAPVGEANIVERMRSTEAVLGGEGNGGIIDPEAHFGRDAAVAAVRLAEAHAQHPEGLTGLASAIPPRYLRKGKLRVRGDGRLLEGLQPRLGSPDDRSDGLRWARSDGFVHLRFSATEPILRVIVEAGSSESADRLFELVVKSVSEGHGG